MKDHLQKAAVPASVLSHSLATPSLVAHIMYQKFAMGIPLNRMEKDFYRPKKDNKVDKKQEYIDNNDRIEVERAFSLAKRRYGLGLITAKLDTTTRSSIALSIIAMNVNRLTVVSFAQILVSLFSRYKLMHCTVKYMQNKSYRDLAIC